MPRYKYEQHTHMSVTDLLDTAIPHIESPTFESQIIWGREKWCGISESGEITPLVRDGWTDKLAEAMDVADSAVSTVIQATDMPKPVHYWDVAGGEADVAMFLSGDPECMIDWHMPMQENPHGRIITLVASTAVSCAVSARSIERRGHAITSLALALQKLGYNTELWADNSSSASPGGKADASTRTLVKSANDIVDDAHIMFAYCHPSFQRILNFGAMHEWSAEAQQRNGVGTHYGYPAAPRQNMEEGTIYLPQLLTSSDSPEPERLVMDTLRTLGIID